MSVTWDWFKPLSDQIPADQMPDDWVWDRLRERRNRLLVLSDFRVLPGVPWDVEGWIEYRQALRDLPDVTVNPRMAVWPVPPS